MSTELEQITGAGGTLSLGGQTYLLKQLNLSDYAQIQAWLRQRLPRPFQVVAEALKDLLPLKEMDPAAYEATRKELMLAAMEDAKKGDGVGADPVMVEQALNSPDGMAYILWLCIRKEHPEVKLETIDAALKTENIGEVKKKLDEITIFSTDEDDSLPNGRTGRRVKAA